MVRARQKRQRHARGDLGTFPSAIGWDHPEGTRVPRWCHGDPSTICHPQACTQLTRYVVTMSAAFELERGARIAAQVGPSCGASPSSRCCTGKDEQQQQKQLRMSRITGALPTRRSSRVISQRPLFANSLCRAGGAGSGLSKRIAVSTASGVGRLGQESRAPDSRSARCTCWGH